MEGKGTKPEFLRRDPPSGHEWLYFCGTSSHGGIQVKTSETRSSEPRGFGSFHLQSLSVGFAGTYFYNRHGTTYRARCNMLSNMPSLEIVKGDLMTLSHSLMIMRL